MKTEILFLLLASVVLVKCENMILGDVSENRIVVHHTSAQYPGISNLRRLKYVVYTSLDLKPIVGIEVIDRMGSKAHANVLAGGVGYTFVTIKLKSEKNLGLDYDIKIYA